MPTDPTLPLQWPANRVEGDREIWWLPRTIFSDQDCLTMKSPSCLQSLQPLVIIKRRHGNMVSPTFWSNWLYRTRHNGSCQNTFRMPSVDLRLLMVFTSDWYLHQSKNRCSSWDLERTLQLQIPLLILSLNVSRVIWLATVDEEGSIMIAPLV